MTRLPSAPAPGRSETVGGPLVHANSVLGTNTYVLGGSDGTCVVIDPGSDDAAIAGLVDRCGLRPERIVLTHGHFDHVLSSAALQRRWDVPVHLHPDDAATLARGSFLMMAMRFAGRVERPECVSMSDLPARLAGHRVRWHHTPGHTPGSCVVGIGSQWFTGDTLYTAGVGLSKLPGEDEGVLRESIRSLRAVLPDADTINPGHGRPGTVSAVWATNRSLAAFLGDARTTTLETGS